MSNLVRVSAEYANADRGHKRSVALPRGAYVPGKGKNDGMAGPGDLIEGLDASAADALVEAGLVERIKAPTGHVPDEDEAEPKLPRLDDLAEFLADKGKALVENLRRRDRRSRPGSRAAKIYKARLKELVD